MLRKYTENLRQGINLSEAEAEEVLEEILSDRPEDSEIAELLVALAEKGETPEEITGFARVMRRKAVSIQSGHPVCIDTAGTGGGRETFNISTAAVFVIAGAGVPVAKHGNRAITSRSGSADVLIELGVSIDVPPSLCAEALNEIGLCFMFAPHFHPAMKRVAGIRRQLGRRTIFNMLGPLTNPASAPYQIIGVYSVDLTTRLAESLKRLGCQRAWVVHSYDGLDEISVADRTRVAEVNGTAVRSFEFRPEQIQFGVPPGGSPAENAVLIRGILENKVSGPARDVVILNAAAALHMARGCRFDKALADAEEAVNSGAALEKLERLREAYAGPKRGVVNRGS